MEAFQSILEHSCAGETLLSEREALRLVPASEEGLCLRCIEPPSAAPLFFSFSFYFILFFCMCVNFVNSGQYCILFPIAMVAIDDAS